MRFPRFFQRRELWWPTWAGWFALALAFASLATLVAKSADALLAPDAPVQKSKVLIVEGWLSATELEQALHRLQSDHYTTVITSGGPLNQLYETRRETNPLMSYAELAARYLNARSTLKIVAVPAPASAQERTYLSAVMVRQWAEREGVRMDAFDVFSSGFHARRTLHLYRLAFGESAAIGIIPAIPEEYSTAYWWRSSAGVKTFIAETVGLAWAFCCFSPSPPGSAAEMWGVGNQ